jgi:hypothetical protein
LSNPQRKPRERDLPVKAARGNRSKDRPVYQPWYEGDFWTLRVRRRRPMVRLMYRSVLQGAWDLDPPGWIPNDEETLMNLADCPDRETWLSHKDELLSMFELSEDGTHYTNERQQQELANWREIRRDYARRGRMGGKAKQAKQLNGKQKTSSATENSSSATNHASNQASTSTSTSTKPVPVPSQVEEKSSCAETNPAPPSTVKLKAVILLPLNSGEEFAIEEADFVKWKGFYPAVDVMQELRKMAAWLDAKPDRRKTRRGVKAFIVRWLSRAQDEPKAAANFTIEKSNGSNSKADRNSAHIRESTGRVFAAARSALIDDSGRLQEQTLGRGAAVVDPGTVPGNGKVLDAGDAGGGGRDDKKPALVRGPGT